MDLGHLFKDTESFVISWGTDGLSLTTTEAIANMTSTGEAPWDVTRHTYLRSVAATRLALCTVYLFAEYRRSINVGEVRTWPAAVTSATNAAFNAAAAANTTSTIVHACTHIPPHSPPCMGLCT